MVAGLARVTPLAHSAPFAPLLGVGLLLGLEGCASHTPMTSSAESAAKASTQPETAALESAARSQTCSAGSADCDGNAANACEALLAKDPKNCGACGVTCAAQNGEGSCLGGTCRMVFCIPGHCDLDGDPKNGCECARFPPFDDRDVRRTLTPKALTVATCRVTINPFPTQRAGHTPTLPR